MHPGGRKFKFFSAERSFTDHILTGELIGEDSAGASRQGVLHYFLYTHKAYKHT